MYTANAVHCPIPLFFYLAILLQGIYPVHSRTSICQKIIYKGVHHSAVFFKKKILETLQCLINNGLKINKL